MWECNLLQEDAFALWTQIDRNNSQYGSGDSNLYASDDFGKAFVGSSEWIASAIVDPSSDWTMSAIVNPIENPDRGPIEIQFIAPFTDRQANE